MNRGIIATSRKYLPSKCTRAHLDSTIIGVELNSYTKVMTMDIIITMIHSFSHPRTVASKFFAVSLLDSSLKLYHVPYF